MAAPGESEPQSGAADAEIAKVGGTDVGGTDTAIAQASQTPAEAAARIALGKLAAELGDDLLDSYVKPTGDLWVRVSADAWQQAGIVARDVLDCVWFDFLSVIDWLPSPFGRDMETEQDRVAHGAPAKELGEIEQGYAGGQTRLQVFARVTTARSTQNGSASQPPAETTENGLGAGALSATGLLSLILKADVPDDNPVIDTWIPVYAGADWHEREAWEMFGVVFNGHPDLRHIYLPSEFEGHPLRKDFPLLARRVKPWPGIVDVELMPGDDAEESASEAD